MKSSKLIATFLFTSFLLVLISMPLNYSHAVKTACDFLHKECFTEAGYPACYKKIDTEKYYQFVAENKLDIAEQIINDDKKCIKLLGNEKAFLQDKGGGYVKFALRGKDVTYWARRDALFSR